MSNTSTRAVRRYVQDRNRDLTATKAQQALNAWLDKQIDERPASQEQPE